MTFIDGIAASENIDSSGERIQIAGMDISSLAVDGVFTYEHEQATDAQGKKIIVKMPEQTVGKILKAKKIFSDKDCEDERQKYFWEKCKTPYIYIMGELFDDYTAAARDLAGKFRYDADHMSQNERTVCNFSIEGAYIAKQGIEVTRSVARKCTIAVLPCNKAARAEMIPSKEGQKNDIDSLFKTEGLEIELFKTETLTFGKMKADMSDLYKHAAALGLEPMMKNVIPFRPASAPALPSVQGRSLGNTKSGMNVMSHAKIHEYKNFSAQDHQDAANLHHSAAQTATDRTVGAHHLDKMKLHLQAGKTAEFKAGRMARAQPGYAGMNKTLDAGSGMAAPGQLTGGAALAKEDLKKSDGEAPKTHSQWTAPDLKPGERYHMASHSPHTGSMHYSGHISTKKGLRSAVHTRDSKFGAVMKHVVTVVPAATKMTKSELADHEYQNWDKRVEFIAFMQETMPNLAKGEIDALGKTLVLKKTIDAETSLSKLVKKP